MTKLIVSDKGQKHFITKCLYVQNEEDITWRKSIRNINHDKYWNWHVDNRNVMAEGPRDISNVSTFKEALLGEKGNDSGK